MQIFKELQRRNVFRVAIGYVVSSWLLAQVADLVLDAIGAPAWVMQTILLVLALGFPVVVFFSWAYEVTPDGIKRESEVDRTRSITHVTARKLNRSIIAVLVVALAYFAFDKFVLSPARQQAPVETTVQTTAHQSQSIAVLPFVNMSDDESNEYFSEGLSEELLNLLSQNPDLSVAARTSSFSFKGQQLEISEIARRLNVSHVLEGSVRRDGDQVRITAQLIKAADGYHLWSETYDRTLDNIFAVQDEIAREITAALLPRIVKPGADSAAETAGRVQYTPPAEVFQNYLLAKNLFNNQGDQGRKKALDILTPMVREHADYADAQALFAHVMYYSASRIDGDIPWIVAEPQINRAVRRALALNSALAEAYLVEGLMYVENRDLLAGIDSFEKAIASNPSYSAAYVELAQAAMANGQKERAWAALDRARELDPVSPLMLEAVVRIATYYDRPQLAEDAMTTLQQVDVERAGRMRVAIYRIKGEIARAVIALQHFQERYPDSDTYRLSYMLFMMDIADQPSQQDPRSQLWIAARNGDKERALQLAGQLAADETDPHDRADIYWITYVLLGMYDEALTELSNLWYGYAGEQMGQRMNSFDCGVLVQLLGRAGRDAEAAPIIAMMRDQRTAGMNPLGVDRREATLLLAEGKLDEAFSIFERLADEGYFDVEYGVPYAFTPSLHEMPGFPALKARAEAWQKSERDLYWSLRTPGHP